MPPDEPVDGAEGVPLPDPLVPVPLVPVPLVPVPVVEVPVVEVPVLGDEPGMVTAVTAENGTLSLPTLRIGPFEVSWTPVTIPETGFPEASLPVNLLAEHRRCGARLLSADEARHVGREGAQLLDFLEVGGLGEELGRVGGVVGVLVLQLGNEQLQESVGS